MISYDPKYIGVLLLHGTEDELADAAHDAFVAQDFNAALAYAMSATGSVFDGWPPVVEAYGMAEALITLYLGEPNGVETNHTVDMRGCGFVVLDSHKKRS